MIADRRGARCERHGLAVDDGGACALCRRGRRRAIAIAERGHDPLRGLAKMIVAILAGLATFAALLALCDRGGPSESPAEGPAVDAAEKEWSKSTESR